MSCAVDANVLVYASNRSSPVHAQAVQFLAERAAGSEILCVGWITLMAYLRIVTHPSLLADPLSPLEAERNVGSLLALPNVRVLTEEDGFWDVYRTATRGLTVRGNLVPDAHLAALLLQHGVRTLYTTDVDFRRFDFLELRNPCE